MGKVESCYICGNKATTREHVPPLCIFPEKKDVLGFDLRINLITVPSCDEHNLKKSKEDEFLLACMAGVVGNNDIGFLHNRTKVSRIFSRRGDSFINVINRYPKNFTIRGKNGIDFPVIFGQPDLPRLRKCFEYIARGLYYHEFNEIFKGECIVFPGFVKYIDNTTAQYLEVIQRRFALDLDRLQTKGSNPLIFKYWIIEPDENGFIGMRITFYGGTNVYFSFVKENLTKPYSLAAHLIESGMKVTVEFPDGKPGVVFNKS